MMTVDTPSIIAEIERLKAENERLRAENTTLSELAFVDPLTGVTTRRKIRELLVSEVKRASRAKGKGGKPVSVVFLDIDNFGRFNKKYGESEGDRALCLFTNSIKWYMETNMRGYEFLGRLGGEEFVLILPETTEFEAYRIIERIRSSIEAKMTINCAGVQERITFSAGVASSEDLRNDDPTKLIELANEGVISAKAAGKNCTFLNLCGALLSRDQIARIESDSNMLAVIRQHRAGMIAITRDGFEVPFPQFLASVQVIRQGAAQDGDFRIQTQGDSTCSYVAYLRAPNEDVRSAVRDTFIQVVDSARRANLLFIPDPETTLWQAPAKINSLSLLVTHTCPMDYTYCKQPHEKEYTLPLEKWQGVIDEVTEDGKRTGVVLWITGGEPFSKRNLTLNLLRHGTSRGMYCAINTNAILLDDGNVGAFLDTGVKSINVSLDSSIPALEDLITRTPGAYNRVMDGLNAVGSHRDGTSLLRVTLNYVLTNQNYASFVDFVKTMCRIRESSGVVLFDDINPLPVKDMDGAYLNIEQIRAFNARIIPEILFLARRHHLPLLEAKIKKIFAYDISDQGERMRREYLASNGVYYGFDGMHLPCALAMTSVTVLPTGDVFPCTYHREAVSADRVVIGNVNDSSLREMQAKRFELLRRLPHTKSGTPNSVCATRCSPDLVESRRAIVHMLRNAGAVR